MGDAAPGPAHCQVLWWQSQCYPAMRIAHLHADKAYRTHPRFQRQTAVACLNADTATKLVCRRMEELRVLAVIMSMRSPVAG